MAPTLAKPFHRPGWVYEEKYDGWRMVAYKDGARVRLISRNNVDHTERFRELRTLTRTHARWRSATAASRSVRCGGEKRKTVGKYATYREVVVPLQHVRHAL
jgi:hypothetical protein